MLLLLLSLVWPPGHALLLWSPIMIISQSSLLGYHGDESTGNDPYADYSNEAIADITGSPGCTASWALSKIQP